MIILNEYKKIIEYDNDIENKKTAVMCYNCLQKYRMMQDCFTIFKHDFMVNLL